MKRARHWVFRVVAVPALFVLCSCVTPDYIPDKSVTQKISAYEARKTVKAELSRVPKPHILVGNRFENLSTGRLTSTKLTIVTDKGTVIVRPLRALKSIHAAWYSSDYCPSVMSLDPFLDIDFCNISNTRITGFADALFVLSQTAPDPSTLKEDEARFRDSVRSYQAAAVKPPLSEEVRRFKTQAEGAVRDKDFDDAADLYEKALAIAPWWPEGHFNRALVLGEVEDFDLAIVEMKRYLVLMPDAADARAAQDKIYDWERKAR